MTLLAANDNTPHWPRGLRRLLAAAYVGVSPNHWDAMVADGRMPAPKRFDNRTVWDKVAVDLAFDMLAGGSARANDGAEIIEFAA